MISIADMMNCLVERRARHQSADVLADIFERLVWCTDDNGEDLLQVRDEWLRGDDQERIAIALAMDGTFPFDDRGEMVRQFQRISQRWPEFTPRCHEILASWDRLVPASETKKTA